MNAHSVVDFKVRLERSDTHMYISSDCLAYICRFPDRNVPAMYISTLASLGKYINMMLVSKLISSLRRRARPYIYEDRTTDTPVDRL